MAKFSRICVISYTRSGSSLLMDWLSQSGLDLQVYSEIFLDRPARHTEYKETIWAHLIPEPRYYDWRMQTKARRPFAPLAYLKKLERETDRGGIAFKLMSSHLHAKPELLWPLISRRYLVVHLYRENGLDLVISRKALEKTGLAHTDGSAQRTKLHLDPADCVAELDRDTKRIEKMKRLLRRLPIQHLTYTYEQITQDPQRCVQEIADKSGAVSDQAIEIQSCFKRVNPAGQQDKIENYEELAQALKQSSYASYLTAPGP